MMSRCEDMVIMDSDSTKQLGKLRLSRGRRSILVSPRELCQWEDQVEKK